MTRPQSPADPLARLEEDLPALLELLKEDPYDAHDALELLASARALARLPASDRPADLQREASLVLEGLPEETIGRAIRLVTPSAWVEDHEELVRAVEGLGSGLNPAHQADCAAEASRLFWLLDQWRLGLLGAARRAPLGPEVQRLLEELEAGPVDRFHSRPEIFLDVAGEAEAWFYSFSADLFREDEQLAATMDTFAVIVAMASPRAAEEVYRELRSGRPGVVIPLPDYRHLAAAGGPQPPPLSFLWEEAETDDEAWLEFECLSREEEDVQEAELHLVSEKPIQRVRLFGRELPVVAGTARIRQDLLRDAVSQGESPTLLVLDPESGEWRAWPMTSPGAEESS